MSGLPDWNLEPIRRLMMQNAETEPLLCNPLLLMDTWRIVEDLGMKIAEHDRIVNLHFEKIEQDWLKLLVKLYILARKQHNLSIKTLLNDLKSFNKVSRFFKEKSIFSPEQINDYLFEEYSYYLKSLKLSISTISKHYSSLCGLLDYCRQEGWLSINTYWFQGKQIKYIPNNDDIEYIPEKVWNQVSFYLKNLPEPIQRMIILIRSTGIRIGELLSLPLNCLRKRENQWRLRLKTEKYNIEDELAICPELVTVIKEQQKYIRYHFKNSYNILFNGHLESNKSKNGSYQPLPKPMGSKSVLQNK